MSYMQLSKRSLHAQAIDSFFMHPNVVDEGEYLRRLHEGQVNNHNRNPVRNPKIVCIHILLYLPALSMLILLRTQHAMANCNMLLSLKNQRGVPRRSICASALSTLIQNYKLTHPTRCASLLLPCTPSAIPHTCPRLCNYKPSIYVSSVSRMHASSLTSGVCVCTHRRCVRLQLGTQSVELLMCIAIISVRPLRTSAALGHASSEHMCWACMAASCPLHCHHCIFAFRTDVQVCILHTKHLACMS